LDLARLPSSGPDASPIVVGRSPLIDEPAPDIDLISLEGEEVSLAQLRGRPVIVNFWASWCTPCRTEFGLFKETRIELADEGLEILGVIYKDDPASARAFYDAQGATWPGLVDPDGNVAAAYGVIGLPITYYVDRDGIVRTVSYGPPPADVLREQLDRIL
jgi:cytochrome c biogenesis protein CcmG, thiol:disulfide interchange protein DsbE